MRSYLDFFGYSLVSGRCCFLRIRVFPDCGGTSHPRWDNNERRSLPFTIILSPYAAHRYAAGTVLQSVLIFFHGAILTASRQHAVGLPERRLIFLASSETSFELSLTLRKLF